MKKTFALFSAAILMTSLIISGCETTKGVGKDVEHAGEGLQNVANDVQH
jgi:predicted small secreted protein